MANKVDDAIYSEARSHAQELEQVYGARDTLFERYERMYLLDWQDKPNVDGVRVTISPDPRNKVLGAKRLLIATDPVFSVPASDDIDNSDDIEQAATRLWVQAGRAARMPVHYMAVESALLYGEVHIAITSTADMVERAAKGSKARMERLAAMTPYLFSIWNPRYGYPEFDIAGLRGYYRKVDVKVSELAGRFGEAVQPIVESHQLTDEVELSIWYDDVNWAVWVNTQPIIAEPHELPFIPVSVTITGGSMLFEKPEQQRQPLLYTVEKSSMWERENLALTTLYTNLYNIAINPTFLHTAPPGNPTKVLSPDFSKQGGVIDLEAGERLEPMVTKGILDPSFQQALQIAEQKLTESTIYSQALGEPLTGSPAFSTVALLSQSGRLPLIETQKLVGEAIADTMEKALLWYRSGKPCKALQIKPSDIPEYLQLDVQLDVDLPQDKLQMANIAGMLTRADNPLTTKEWARENILNIGQSTKMEEDILAEKMFEALAQQYLNQALAQQYLMKRLQQAQAQPPVQVPQQQGEGIPPGATPVPVGAEGQGMNPAMGGLPPQMAGMIPGMGEGQMPEGMPPEMGGMNG